MSEYVHDPNAVLDYLWPWTGWLVAGDALASFEILAGPEVAVSRAGITPDGVVAFLGPCSVTSGVVPVTCRVTTTGGRIDDRTIRLRIMQR